MIIVRISGGLGNQMFQYACGRALAERLSTVLKLDLQPFESDPLRDYALHSLNIHEHIAIPNEIALVKGLSWGEKAILKFGRRFGSQLAGAYLNMSGSHFREKKVFEYDSSILNLKDSIYLDGYWQSEEYFIGVRDILLREFTARHIPSSEMLEEMGGIAETSSIALHVRRGDYVSSPATSRTHGFCGLDYYSRAVAHMAAHVADPHFFVFSDDLPWAIQNLCLDFPTIFVGESIGNAAHDDLMLMKECQHHIIANSSFSWWGAWLCTNENQIVIAPKRWFADERVQTPDLLPSNWLQM